MVGTTSVSQPPRLRTDRRRWGVDLEARLTRILKDEARAPEGTLCQGTSGQSYRPEWNRETNAQVHKYGRQPKPRALSARLSQMSELTLLLFEHHNPLRQ